MSLYHTPTRKWKQLLSVPDTPETNPRSVRVGSYVKQYGSGRWPKIEIACLPVLYDAPRRSVLVTPSGLSFSM
jgi:hypothetical protein